MRPESKYILMNLASIPNSGKKVLRVSDGTGCSRRSPSCVRSNMRRLTNREAFAYGKDALV